MSEIMNVEDVHFNRNDIHEAVEEWLGEDIEDIIDETIDLTIAYVVSWLEARGNPDLSELLATLSTDID